jgi:ABC-type arginine transport system ATPase subunit
MSDVILKVDSLNAWYGRAQVLFDMGLDVRRGENPARREPACRTRGGRGPVGA